MGRNAKPVELAGERKHLTQEEIEYRKLNEEQMRIENTVLRESSEVRTNSYAHKMFKRLKAIYKDFQFVDVRDSEILNRYCLLTAQVKEDNETLEYLRIQFRVCKDLKLLDAVDVVTRRINKAHDMLLKIEDRTFLNPASRIKAIPVKPPEEPPGDDSDLFG